MKLARRCGRQVSEICLNRVEYSQMLPVKSRLLPTLGPPFPTRAAPEVGRRSGVALNA
jgi:hypothetical protein